MVQRIVGRLVEVMLAQFSMHNAQLLAARKAAQVRARAFGSKSCANVCLRCTWQAR